MDDDFDDLLGTPAPAQTNDFDDEDEFDLDKDEVEVPYASAGKGFTKTLTAKHVDRALRGAPPKWYADLLGIGRTTVQRKLAHLNPRVVGNGTKLYEPREALPCLVQPHDLKKHLSQMNPRDLPERLRKEFWGARKLEQQVRKEAGDLWSSADVNRMLGDLMKLIKDNVLLWADTVGETQPLTNEQVMAIDDLGRNLLSQIAESIQQYANTHHTRSHEAEYDEDDGVNYGDADEET